MYATGEMKINLNLLSFLKNFARVLLIAFLTSLNFQTGQMVSSIVLGVIVGCGSFVVVAGSLIYAFIRWRRRDQVTMAIAVEDEQNQPAERPQTTGNVIRDGQELRPSSRSAASVATDRMRSGNDARPQRVAASQVSLKPLNR